ncbi:MAK10-like protein [Tanacetum coccineum]
MGDENPIRTLRDYSKSSHEGYRNTIELLVWNNVDSFHHMGGLLLPRFLAPILSFGRTAKLRNDILMFTTDILMFQQHHGESLSEAWTQDVALFDNESWNDPRDFTKPVKAIALPQDVPSTSDRRLIELENQVQRLMEAHLAPTQPTQVNKITTSCEICSGPYNTQYCMEDPEQAFVEYASSHTDEAGDARLSNFEVDFKRQQGEMTNKIDTVLKVITDQIVSTLPSDTVKNPKLGTQPVLSARSYLIIDPQCSSHPSNPINVIKAHFKEATISQTSLRLGDSKLFDTLADLGSCVNMIPLYLFKKLNIRLLEETDHIFGLADGTKSYPVGIVKDVEVHIRKLKLLNDFYVIDMKKDPETPLLVGRGFLATANAAIDCRMTKIAVGEGITRSVFEVKGVDLGEEEAPYWTPLGRRESYKPRPLSNGIGVRTRIMGNC